jgi:A1 cistron-splicing factor AAR2
MPLPSPSHSPQTPTLLFRSIPPSTFLGLDLLSLTTSPNLHGIKNLPPGYHFLYSSFDASLSIRHGRWFYIAPPGAEREPEILVWRWSTEEECLMPAELDTDAIQNARPDLRRISERGVLNYTQPSSGGANGSVKDACQLVKEWRELTGYITGGLLDRLLGPRPDQVKGYWSVSSVSSAPQDVENIPGLTASEAAVEGEKELNFLPVDLKRTWREGAVGRERTDAARDRSWYLGQLVEQAAASGRDRKVGAAQLLGELQLCFLMVLTLANWSCLEQWKRILSVLLSCRQSLGEVEEYFVVVVKVLAVQLRHCEDVEGGLFDFREDGAGWLRGLLAQLGANVEDVFGAVGGEDLKAELSKIDDYLRGQYGWESGKDILKRGLLELEDGERVDMDMNGADEEDETGEYAPVVVDLG